MNYLEIFGTLVGLVYLWLEYRASFYLWIASLVMPIIYIFIYYQAGLYADFAINVYYIIASVYGLVCWTFHRGKKNNTESPEVPITYTPRSRYIPLIALTIALTMAIAQILLRFTDSNVPWEDGFTTALSIIAMWMLAKKYVEQWLAWMIVDIVSSVLYIYKGLYFTSGLYAIYTLIAYFGYLKWKQLLKAQAH